MAKRKGPRPLPPAPLGLDERLAAIGIMISAKPISREDIETVDLEATLADAIVALGLDLSDMRILAPLLTWIAEHGSAIIVEKLAKILSRRRNLGVDVSFAAFFAAWATSQGHKRWSTIRDQFADTTRPPRLVGPSDVAASLLSLRGPEAWPQGSGFLVPKGALTPNSKWILSRKALARQHRQYRNRLIYGAQWRADIVTAYELGARTAAEASRMSGASYEPCHRVRGELEAAGILA